MKKFFMLLFVAAAFAACDSGTTSEEGTVVEQDTVDVDVNAEYEVETTTVEIDTTTETETVEADTVL